MAMNIISKEKKEIKWVGLPTNSVQECKHLEVFFFTLDWLSFFLVSFNNKISKASVKH